MPATAMAIDYGASGSSEGDQLLAIRSCAKLTECRLGSQQVDPILSQLSAARASE
jgi:NADH:ubiquinone oxidoreductase subunit F (NADH-binding)